MKKLHSWLQISDLHIFDSTDWQIMIDSYKTLAEEVHPDFLVVTGDFRHKKFNNHYSFALTFLNQLVEIFNLKKEDVFLVPGNHDVNSFDYKKEFVSVINHEVDVNPDIYREYLTDKKDLTKAFTEYERFVKEFYGDSVNDERVINCKNVYYVPWNDCINIVAINTALISSGKSDEKEIADIYTLSKLNVNKEFPTIMLAHHDINSLYESHQSRLCHIIQELNVKAYLCGDKHKLLKEGVEKLTAPNTTIPVIVCGKSAIETGDKFSDLCAIEYNWYDNGKTYVQVYRYKEHSFVEANDFYYNIRKRYYFFMADKLTKTPEVVSCVTKSSSKRNKGKKKEKANNYQSIWLPDAELADGTQTRFNSFTLTKEIEKYLKDNGSHLLGISSVKGIGKTFLLQVKRVKSSRKYFCLPSCPKPSVENNWATERVSFDSYSKLKTSDTYNDLVILWKFAIKCYLINTFLDSHNENDKLLKEYLKKNKISKDIYDICKDCHNSSLESIISGIIDIDDWNILINNSSIAIGAISRIILKRRKVNDKKAKSIAIFIDKVDQSIKQTNAEPPADCVKCNKKNNYQECICSQKGMDYCVNEDGCKSKNCCYGCELFASSKSNAGLRIYENPNVEKLVHINIWQYLQLALVNAADQIYSDFQGQVKVFYTIRQEAFNCEEQRLGEQNQKIGASIFYLTYTIEEQRKIFIDCIKQQTPELLFAPEFQNKKGQEEYSFVGVSDLCHPYCLNRDGSNKKETIFSSIYRHSFDRTRDIQRFGEGLTNIISTLKHYKDQHEREEIVKQTIEDIAASLAYCSKKHESTVNPSYYTEKMKYLPNYWADNENFEVLLSLIDRNLLFEDEAKTICRKINGYKECPECGCKGDKCKRHPFSMLYNMGYLGYILSNHNNSAKEIQHFLDSNEVCYFVEKDDLNSNERVAYIIHPALTKTIEKKYNKRFMHFSGFILGKGLTVDTDVVSQMISDKQKLNKQEFESKYYHKPC